MKIERTCEECGQTYRRHPSQAGRFCSHKCRLANLHQSNRSRPRDLVDVECAVCGKAMRISHWRHRNYLTHHCSRACMGRSKAALAGEGHPLFKPKVLMHCEVCGEARLVKPSLESRFRACSRRCAAALSQSAYPRTSSIERAVASELERIGEEAIPQHRIRWYVVDFFLPRLNLIIECDGDYWHSLPRQKSRDRGKDAYLTSHGYRVARLPEAAIKADVHAAVSEALHLTHSPAA